ncbi:MAG: HD domain-containing protein [Candidatus Margulisiibacteriota bacterium]
MRTSMLYGPRLSRINPYTFKQKAGPLICFNGGSGGPPQVQSFLRIEIERREDSYLSPFATKSACDPASNDRRAYFEKPDLYRTRFARDRDRIIHALHFILLSGKTQVFPVLPSIPHPIITTRAFHVLRLSQLARSIARAIGLNENLVEAIALGHDMGHMPFGHAGERAIQEATMADVNLIGGRKFKHEPFALRVVDALETIEGRNISGLNLTFEVRDGIARHCGEDLRNELVPSTEMDLNIQALPTTLEGCLIKIMDVVGYAPQDLRDLMYAGYITWEVVPSKVKQVLGTSIREMYNTLVNDIITNSQGKNMIMMSPQCFTALEYLKDFIINTIKDNFKEIEPKLKRDIMTYYQKRKEQGILPQQIIDEMVGMTDKQLFEQLTHYQSLSRRALAWLKK